MTFYTTADAFRAAELLGLRGFMMGDSLFTYDLCGWLKSSDWIWADKFAVLELRADRILVHDPGDIPPLDRGFTMWLHRGGGERGGSPCYHRPCSRTGACA